MLRCGISENSTKELEFIETNDDLENVVTPVDVKLLKQLLSEARYDKAETEYLVAGFSQGFDLEYEGPMEWKDMSRNIPLDPEVGSPQDLWDKMIKEVKLGRFAGPFETVLFEFFVQSPVGLVPKAGNQSRLIFHLSYDFKDSYKSINHYIPANKCSVKYKDIDHAVRCCLQLKKDNPEAQIWLGISDLKSAFRMVPLA